MFFTKCHFLLFKDDSRQVVRTSASIIIPSPHSSNSSIARPTTIPSNGHSRSMDFQSNSHPQKSELLRPIALKNGTHIYDTSSSSLATIASVRSSTSLEFDDDTKPSGVLVDDDFLPMSSPVDEHFWDKTPFHDPNSTAITSAKSSQHHHLNQCFPNVGSSPDIEKKQFNPQAFQTLSMDQPLSETSCDEDEETLLNQQPFAIQHYHLKELQKPMVIHRAALNPSLHTSELPNNHHSHPQLHNEMISVPIRRLCTLIALEREERMALSSSFLSALERIHQDESLLEKFASSNSEALQIPIRSPALRPTTSNDIILSSQTIYEEDDTQESSTNDNGSDDSADNGEIDLVHEFELSQKEEQHHHTDDLWNNQDRDIFIVQEDDLLSALVNTPPVHRPLPPSIMKISNHKSIDSIDEAPLTTSAAPLKPKVRFNLDPQYEREREWNKVNKLLGNSVEWTDEFEVWNGNEKRVNTPFQHESDDSSSSCHWLFCRLCIVFARTLSLSI